MNTKEQAVLAILHEMFEERELLLSMTTAGSQLIAEFNNEDIESLEDEICSFIYHQGKSPEIILWLLQHS